MKRIIARLFPPEFDNIFRGKRIALWLFYPLVAVTLWDEDPARLERLGDAVETAISALGTVEGWQLVTLRFVKRRTRRDVAGPWATIFDFRARLLAAD